MRLFTAAAVPFACALAISVATSRGATAQTQDHTYTSADIEAGSRLYAGQCALCHSTTGDGVSGVNLRRGQFRRPMSDEDIKHSITVGVPNAGMPPFTLQPAELNALVAFIRSGFDVSGTAVKVGNAVQGRAVFTGKGACLSCHRVDGNGSRVAPDLSDVGAVRQPAALQRSLLEPTKAMMPINRPVRAVTRDGRTIRGRRLNEDTFTVQIIDDQERLVSLTKSDLREFVVEPASTMPSMAGKLSADEIADLVAYLLSLKG